MKMNKEMVSSYDNSIMSRSDNLALDTSKVMPYAQYPPFWPMPYYPFFEYPYSDQYLPFIHPYGLPFLQTPFTNQTINKKN